MQPLTARQLRGNWATLLLPIAADDRIDFGLLAEELRRIVAFAPSGVYSNGSAGEFYTQNDEEFDRVNRLLAEHCERGGVRFQIGASHMSPQLSLERIRRAKQLHPSALQVILPDWFPPSDEEAYACLSRMAEAADPVKLVLYNPPHAKRVLTPEDYQKLRRLEGALIGIKVADAAGDWYERMRRHAGWLSIFVPGHNLATGHAAGASGAYSNVACIHPGAAQRWWEQMQSDPAGAVTLQKRIHRFIMPHIHPLITEQRYSNIAVDKLLAAVGGWAPIGTRLRWPYRWIDQDCVERYRTIARQLIPEFCPEP